MKTSITSRKKKLLINTGTIAIWFLIWELIYLAVSSSFLFPSPVSVIKRLIELSLTSDFWCSCGLTILRIGGGCLLGIVIGLIFGIITALSDILNTFFTPFLTIIKTTPVASFVILLLVWLSRTGVTLFISILLVTPIIWSNINHAIRSVDKDLLEMSRIYRLSTKSQILKIYIPSVIPSLLSGITTSIGFSWKAGISAEIIAIPQNAIGTNLYYSKINLEYIDVFAWTAAIILLSYLIERVLVSLIFKAFWRFKHGTHIN